MGSQWLVCSTAVFLLLVHINLSHSQSRGCSGIPGIPGSHGRNGVDGVKGAKGDNGEAGRPVMGQKGEQGHRGPAGRAGLKGDAGLPGPAGRPGPRGPKGRPFHPSNQQRSFFSYKRTTQEFLQNAAIDFNSPILPNLDRQFQSDLPLTDGVFTCAIKGVYFFTYHMSAKSRVCLMLMKGSNVHMTLCDTAEGFLVTSGSAVLELEAGDTVSLEASRNSNIVQSQASTSHTLTGFLIFPTP